MDLKKFALKYEHKKLALQHERDAKARLREYYLNDLNFQIPLLENVKQMNDVSVKLRGRPFAGFNQHHDASINKLKMLKQYLEKFPDTWDPQFFADVIDSIPKILEDNEEGFEYTIELE